MSRRRLIYESHEQEETIRKIKALLRGNLITKSASGIYRDALLEAAKKLGIKQ